jgi:hypothetical protein
MQEVTDDDRMMRRFILDQLNAGERERIEEQFITDGVFNEKLLISEEDLIEDYLDNSLDDEERERFESIFRSSSEQSRKLAIARLIRTYAADEASSEPITSEIAPAVWQNKQSVATTDRRQWVKLLVAAGILIALFVSLWLLTRDSSRRQAVDLKHQALEKDLADLNSGSRSGMALPPNESMSVILPPLNTRSSGLARISGTPGVSVVELWLLPTSLNYEKFKARIRRDGASERFDIFNLTLSDRPQGRAVRLRIPADLLEPGTYQIDLQAVAASGEPVSVGEYQFQVTP